jgi:hypothetical protein
MRGKRLIDGKNWILGSHDVNPDVPAGINERKPLTKTRKNDHCMILRIIFIIIYLTS